MNHYLVSWAIDIEADTPREAAEEASKIQREPGEATFFEVQADDGTVTDINL